MNWYVFVAVLVVSVQTTTIDDEWVHLPDKCEDAGTAVDVPIEDIRVCKFVSIEMKAALEETGKTKEVIETNYRFLDDKGAPPIKYVKSDIRFIEVMESVCSRILQYSLHKERDGSNRFAKGMSETFSTLHNLVHKGVKVVMDIPYELWNETSAEVADLKKQCDVLIEQYEDVIEDWYKGSQEEDLMTYLCENHVLKGQDTSCLNEAWMGKKGDTAAIDKDKKKKGKRKKPKDGESGQKKEKKVKKKKKKITDDKYKQQKQEDQPISDEDIQDRIHLHKEKTEL